MNLVLVASLRGPMPTKLKLGGFPYFLWIDIVAKNDDRYVIRIPETVRVGAFERPPILYLPLRDSGAFLGKLSRRDGQHFSSCCPVQGLNSASYCPQECGILKGNSHSHLSEFLE